MYNKKYVQRYFNAKRTVRVLKYGSICQNSKNRCLPKILLWEHFYLISTKTDFFSEFSEIFETTQNCDLNWIAPFKQRIFGHELPSIAANCRVMPNWLTDSKSRGGNTVWVRPPLPAYKIIQRNETLIELAINVSFLIVFEEDITLKLCILFLI